MGITDLFHIYKYVFGNKKASDNNMSKAFVGATGFEPAAAWSQTRSATGLRYTPNTMQKETLGNCRGDRIRTCGRLVPNQERYRAALHPEYYAEGDTWKLSGRQDSNLRPPGPKPGALPGCATPRCITRKCRSSYLRVQRYNIFPRYANFSAII